MGKRILILLLAILSIHARALDIPYCEELYELSPAELFRRGDEYMKLDHLDKAMGYYIVLAGKYNLNMDQADKYRCAQVCNYIGQIYYQKENYAKAFEMYLKGLQISEENNFVDLFPEYYKNIGNIYGLFMDYDQSIVCHQKALQYAREQGNVEVETKLLENLIGSCCFSDKTEEAKIYYAQLMKYVGLDEMVEYFSCFGKARIFVNEEKYDSAVLYYKKTVAYAEKMKLDALYTGAVYGELAKLFKETSRNDSALHYFELNVRFTEENGGMYILAESLKALVQLYEKEGNHRKALMYKERYWAVYDSLFNINEFNKMKNIQFTYEMNRNYYKIATLTTDKEKKDLQIKVQQKILIIVSISLFIFIIFLIIVYYQKKKLHNAYKDLFKRNSEVLQSEKQNKELRIIYENRLAKIENKVPLSESQNEEALLDCKKTENEEEESKLYLTSKLSDRQKKELLQNIDRVMKSPDEFCQLDFSLDRLALLVGSNSHYVSQTINETYNKNFRTFINEYRIKEAQLRLMNTEQYGNYTIQAIAESVGYKSHTNFILIFKKMTGMTPSIFQKIAKDGK